MKRNHRLISLLAALGVLLGCAVMGTSCLPEYLVSPISQYGTTDTVITATIEDSETEQTTVEPPETLPGNDTLAPDCTHRYGEWVVAKEPQCETDGMQYRLCADCNGRQEESIDATGHTEEAIADVPATCTLQGSEGGTRCSECGEIVEQPTPVPVISHSFGAGGICASCGALENGADGLAYLDLYNQSYGYDYLGTMEKGTARQQLYAEMNEAARTFHVDPSMDGKKELEEYHPVVCKINYATLGLTAEEALSVWKTFRDDAPLFYWVSNTVVRDNRNIYLLVDPDYSEGVTRMETNSQLYQNISEYLSLLPAGATDYQIALLIHDRMIESIDYALDGNGQPEDDAWAHTILGVFDERGAVCEGFARAYQLLLNFKGVECLLVTGESHNQGHAWNMIKLDGEWFGVDVTWDDNSEASDPYAYFCLSETEFYQSHTLDLPTDTGTGFLYGVPTLCEYSIEWVELYQGTTLLGRYICVDRAFEAITDKTGTYTLQLLDGKNDAMLHDTKRFSLYGDLPEVNSLTVIGTHTILQSTPIGQSYTATELCLTRNVTLHGKLTLKSLFLTSEKPVTVKENGYSLVKGNYSAIRDYVEKIS